MRILIIGAGEVGYSLARHLASEKLDVVVIESDPDRCERLQESLDLQVLQGNGGSPRLLREAGVEGADIFLAVTSSDEVNMVACRNVGVLSPETNRICRIRNMDYTDLMEKCGPKELGIDLVINPERVAARRIMRMLQVPAAQDVRVFAQGKVRLTAFHVEPQAPAVGKQLMDLDREMKWNRGLVVAVERGDKVEIPHGDTRLQANDYVWVFCSQDGVAEVARMAGKDYFSRGRVCVYGGKRVGYHLIRDLVEEDVPVKVIEPDRKHCEDLAQEFSGVVVLNGVAMDLQLLQEENIGESSVFVAATEHDEDNLLSALLASKQGVRKVIAVMERTDYQSVISTIGVNNIISQNMTAVDLILRKVRKGRILSSSLISSYASADKGSYAEVMEYAVGKGSEITSSPLRQLLFPRGAILGAIVRQGDVIIPTGDDQVQVGDRVLIFAMREVVKKVEDLFTEKRG